MSNDYFNGKALIFRETSGVSPEDTEAFGLDWINNASVGAPLPNFAFQFDSRSAEFGIMSSTDLSNGIGLAKNYYQMIPPYLAQTLESMQQNIWDLKNSKLASTNFTIPADYPTTAALKQASADLNQKALVFHGEATANQLTSLKQLENATQLALSELESGYTIKATALGELATRLSDALETIAAEQGEAAQKELSNATIAHKGALTKHATTLKAETVAQENEDVIQLKQRMEEMAEELETLKAAGSNTEEVGAVIEEFDTSELTEAIKQAVLDEIGGSATENSDSDQLTEGKVNQLIKEFYDALPKDTVLPPAKDMGDNVDALP